MVGIAWYRETLDKESRRRLGGQFFIWGFLFLIFIHLFYICVCIFKVVLKYNLFRLRFSACGQWKRDSRLNWLHGDGEGKGGIKAKYRGDQWMMVMLENRRRFRMESGQFIWTHWCEQPWVRQCTAVSEIKNSLSSRHPQHTVLTSNLWGSPQGESVEGEYKVK